MDGILRMASLQLNKADWLDNKHEREREWVSDIIRKGKKIIVETGGSTVQVPVSLLEKIKT